MANKITPITRRHIDLLFDQGIISDQAKSFGLNAIYPDRNWGLLVSRMLLITGILLVLSGIIYFFAYNWTEITPAIKLGSIQGGMLFCLALYYFTDMQKIVSKISLLSASVMVGVFMAVFGQIYQTGADIYTLFTAWALLILPWVIISEFAASWMIWLLVSNFAITMYFEQAMEFDIAMKSIVYTYLMLFNGFFLALREILVIRGYQWLSPEWIRRVLLCVILYYALCPITTFIMLLSKAGPSLIISTVVAVVIFLLSYIVYRFKLPDVFSVAVTVFAGCLILESGIIKLSEIIFFYPYGSGTLMIAALTLCNCVVAATTLSVITKKMENAHE
ncbi:MAG: DUF2157 domain-containing protein [Gammaproteobacteria bacterium]